jgi:hypothetical protein
LNPEAKSESLLSNLGQTVSQISVNPSILDSSPTRGRLLAVALLALLPVRGGERERVSLSILSKKQRKYLQSWLLEESTTTL